jgi:hypothetical protein
LLVDYEESDAPWIVGRGKGERILGQNNTSEEAL